MGHTLVDSGLGLVCSSLASALQNKGRGQRKLNFKERQEKEKKLRKVGKKPQRGITNRKHKSGKEKKKQVSLINVNGINFSNKDRFSDLGIS